MLSGNAHVIFKSDGEAEAPNVCESSYVRVWLFHADPSSCLTFRNLRAIAA